ncbi:hypothetical protein F0265_11895 [Vibrio sp. RE88]|nr:hypothetical protein [Vibrio sp. RE88]
MSLPINIGFSQMRKNNQTCIFDVRFIMGMAACIVLGCKVGFYSTYRVMGRVRVMMFRYNDRSKPVRAKLTNRRGRHTHSNNE